MALKEIVLYPSPILRAKTASVERFDKNLAALLDDLYETMVVAHGIGLAAPQIGVAQQVTVIDLNVESIIPPEIITGERRSVSPKHESRLELVNPKVTQSEQVVVSNEGCISIPDFRESIKRHEQVRVSAQDRFGNAYELRAEGLLAFALQHEIDHLNGILFIDHLSRLKKHMFQKWYEKQPWKTD